MGQLTIQHPKGRCSQVRSEGTLVQDLVNYGILHVNSDSELLDRWTDRGTTGLSSSLK